MYQLIMNRLLACQVSAEECKVSINARPTILNQHISSALNYGLYGLHRSQYFALLVQTFGHTDMCGIV